VEPGAVLLNYNTCHYILERLVETGQPLEAALHHLRRPFAHLVCVCVCVSCSLAHRERNRQDKTTVATPLPQSLSRAMESMEDGGHGQSTATAPSHTDTRLPCGDKRRRT